MAISRSRKSSTSACMERKTLIMYQRSQTQKPVATRTATDKLRLRMSLESMDPVYHIRGETPSPFFAILSAIMAPRGDLQLTIGYWIVSHKDQLKKWWAVSLLLFIAASFLWALGFFSLFIVQQAKTDKFVPEAAAALSAWKPSGRLRPQPLTISPVTVIARDATHVDMVMTLTNPNSFWGAATVQLDVLLGAQHIPVKTFVNQSDSRPVIVTNVAVAESSLASATATVSDTIWARASDAVLQDAQFAQATDPQIKATTVLLNGQRQSTVNVQAAITNRSVYNYYTVQVDMVLKAGEKIVGVETRPLTDWRTFATKSLNVTWAYPVSGVTSVDIVPEVSRFEQDNIFR